MDRAAPYPLLAAGVRDQHRERVLVRAPQNAVEPHAVRQAGVHLDVLKRRDRAHTVEAQRRCRRARRPSSPATVSPVEELQVSTTGDSRVPSRR